MHVGRFAPSPTGPLHVGNARTALLAWLDARSVGGQFILRMEDIDAPRSLPGMAAQQLEELRWLGLDWDQGPDVGGPHAPYTQSQRLPHYAAAVSRLEAAGRVFFCTCSRKDLQRLASAPHAGEDGPPYPGTCRHRTVMPANGQAARRFMVQPGTVEAHDLVCGPLHQDVVQETGDVVIQRADGVFSYQLAVTVDDGLMGVTRVLRARDLLSSVGRQIQLLEALGHPVPTYAHVPLLHGPDGNRLEKRVPSHTLAGLRELGVAPEAVVGWLAHSAGLQDTPREVAPRDLLAGFHVGNIRNCPDWRHFPSLPR